MDEKTRAWHKDQVAAYIEERPFYVDYAGFLKSLLERACGGLAPER